MNRWRWRFSKQLMCKEKKTNRYDWRCLLLLFVCELNAKFKIKHAQTADYAHTTSTLYTRYKYTWLWWKDNFFLVFFLLLLLLLLCRHRIQFQFNKFYVTYSVFYFVFNILTAQTEWMHWRRVRNRTRVKRAKRMEKECWCK